MLFTDLSPNMHSNYNHAYTGSIIFDKDVLGFPYSV